MFRIASLLILALLVIVTSASADSSPYTISTDSIYSHISILAHDSLEGREVGEPGEWKAAQYIKSVYVAAGLQPAGDDATYFQPFEFTKRIDLGPKNSLTLNGSELKAGEEFIPLSQSASMTFQFDEIVYVDHGITIPESDGDYDDYKTKDVAGKAVLIMRDAPKDSSLQTELDKRSSLADKITNAIDHEAAGVFFVTPEHMEDTIKARLMGYVHPKDIPIVLLRKNGLDRLGLDLHSLIEAQGETELVRVRDTGYNVVGLLAAATDTTIIMGAHYDHLGWGGPSSLYTGKEKMVHNGADDNGSGVAAMLELARHLSSVKNQLRHSVLFIAFSGEETGVLGSGHYAKNMTIDSSKVQMMLNLDMIGRLKEQDKGLAIMGTGTCVEFKEYFDSLKYDDIRLSLKQSGTGPSDHTPFYNRKVPSVTMFTGPHKDYHKPSDDIEFIYTEGILRVTDVARDVIYHFDSLSGPLTFQKTKDPDAGKRRSQFSVTLGVMPDHTAEVKGLRVDGVIPDRPGARAGMLEGDVVIKMGDIDIADIYDYMGALGKFRKGDTTAVMVERGTDTVTLEVVF